MATDTLSPEQQARMRSLGKALNRLARASHQAAKGLPPATLAQRRSLYRARLAGIRFRVAALRQQADQDARLELRADHRRSDRYLERCTMVLLWLAMFACLAAIAARPIGGAA